MQKLRLFIVFSSFLTLFLTPSVLKGQIQGKIYRDFNANGVFDSTATHKEVGLSGITVTAYNAAGTSVGTTTTNSTGNYTIPSVSGALRVQFTGNSTYDFASAKGTDNETSIQFVTAPATGINFALNYPADYCQSTPPITVACYDVGSSTNNVIVNVDYGTTGTSSASKTMLNSPGTTVGAIWGLAFNAPQDRLFSASFMRRHSAFGSGGTGAIYETRNASNPATSSSSLFVNLNGMTVANAAGGTTTINTGADPHSTTYLTDLKTAGKNPFDAVGKIAFGDMDISTDSKYLYVVSLNDKKLIRITIDSDNNIATNPSAADVLVYDLPTPTCVDGNSRPFGLGIRNGKIYVGIICDAETSTPAQTTTSNLTATIYELNGSSFSSVISFPLNYYRGLITWQFGTTNDHSWQPWITDWTNTSPPVIGSVIAYPQPMLSDIVFDQDGSMVLGFADRFGFQTIHQGPDANGTSTSHNPRAGGDILRICNTGNRDNPVYTLESAGMCGTNGGGTFTAATYTPKEQEYYVGDNFDTGGHTETALGGLAILPGTGQVVTTAFDPIPGGSFYTNGFKYLNN